MMTVAKIISWGLLASFSTLAWGRDNKAPVVEQKAAYLVPTAPELATFSLFTNVLVKIRQGAGGAINFEYSLPLELTGVENKIEYSGEPDADGKMVAYGENGQATCEVKGVLAKCEMLYKNIVFDQAARAALLLQLSAGDATALAARTAVAEHFEEMVTTNPSPFVGFGIRPARIVHLPDAGSEPHGVLQLIY